MSVAGCYTDFHVDFGGTSVWYHYHKGREDLHSHITNPSLRSYDLFVRWYSETFQEAIFFADEVDECEVVRLKAGDTLLMPSGELPVGNSMFDHSILFMNYIVVTVQMNISIFNNIYARLDSCCLHSERLTCVWWKFPELNKLLMHSNDKCLHYVSN